MIFQANVFRIIDFAFHGTEKFLGLHLLAWIVKVHPFFPFQMLALIHAWVGCLTGRKLLRRT